MFDFLNKNKKEADIENTEESVKVIDNNNTDDRFALYLLFSKKPEFNISKIESRINKICDGNAKIQNILEKEDTFNIYGTAEIDGEKFKIVGLDISIPIEITEYTVRCAYGQKEELEAMENHSYHIIAFYAGKSTDYNVIYNAYAKLAYGFLEDNFVGMANGYAWNAISPGLLKGLFEDKRIAEMAYTPAMMVWRNFVKMPYGDNVWFVTKGNFLYGVHEYAFKGDSFEDSQQVYDMFEDIFNYEYTERPQIGVGHTIQLGEDIFLRFRDIYELENELEGDGIGTLVLEFITEDEINK
ncbi:MULTISPECIES: hypothetical protein [Clostridium]|uniref:DUF4261 domain-containing protein n=1 Tax=Clostridium butyricum TaxID=1492 RepID=A0A6N3HTX4_CLOBU|nr:MULTISPECIES: hypothetical protein [Clostridium]ENZ35147.1 hypothetical protein HMPREF1084_01156 [Clostridium butyricum 60E.3]MBZ0310987.1 hypothetical protein [Clostridium butyricum]MDI9209068.1 hypothetical protein [Clostridium butyricum]MDU0321378.1 hypothetical protein [Clostridium butyricum]MDU1068492.1 hypothetical protein [Clostridium sp.]